MKFNVDGNIEYTSVLKNDSNFQRNWVFPNPQNNIGVTIEVGENENKYLSKIIDKKSIEIGGKAYEVVKYNVDQILSSDEESNKIYVEEFGVIIETFRRKNKIEVIEMNSLLEDNGTLELIISKLANDEKFIWSQNEYSK